MCQIVRLDPWMKMTWFSQQRSGINDSVIFSVSRKCNPTQYIIISLLSDLNLLFFPSSVLLRKNGNRKEGSIDFYPGEGNLIFFFYILPSIYQATLTQGLGMRVGVV